jgi:uncharacterized protein
MALRVSSYVFGTDLVEQPYYLLGHGLSGALDKVDRDLGFRLLAGRAQSLDAELSELLDEETTARLVERGYLTALDAHAERTLFKDIVRTIHESDLIGTRPNFMLVPAYLCNLRCPYCFQSHDLHAGRGRFATIMTGEQVDRIFRLIEAYNQPGALARAIGLVTSHEVSPEQANSPRNTHVVLFGGEPMMRETRPIVGHILDQVRRRPGFHLSAVTNAVELDLFADLLGPDGVEELQITLDGLPHYHDRRRVGPDHRQTFARIVENVDLALRRAVRVSIRINVDGNNVNQLEPLNRFFVERGWTNEPNFTSYAAVVHDPAAGGHPSPRDQEEKSRAPKKYPVDKIGQAELVERARDLRGLFAQDGIDTYERYAKDYLTAVLGGSGLPFRRTAHCSSETGLLIFDPLGDVYGCWEELGQADRRIASYGEQGLAFEHAVVRDWLSRFPGAIPACSECPYALIHTSGCAKHAEQWSGSKLANACEEFQQFFPVTLADLYLRLEQELIGRTEPRARPSV